MIHKVEEGEEMGEEMWEEKGGVDILSEDYFQSLPPGWWVKEVQVGMGSVVKKFVDSRGKEFMGRIAAVRKLVAKGRMEEAEILRSGLVADGWIQHPLLPTGWWVKPDRVMNNQTRFRFLTATNKWFVGVRKAVSELSSGRYSLEEVEGLHRMLEEFSSKSRMGSTVWQPGGPDMPEGWRFKQCAGKKQGIYTKVQILSFKYVFLVTTRQNHFKFCSVLCMCRCSPHLVRFSLTRAAPLLTWCPMGFLKSR